jgi:hypothetical protein
LKPHFKNKYTLLNEVKDVEQIDGNVALNLQFKLKNNRHQNINLNFFIEGQFPRPQMAEAFAWYFWYLRKGVASETRDGELMTLRKFNAFLNWKAEKSQNISSTQEITFTLLSEYQIWLTTIGNLNEKSAYHNYSAVCRIISLLRLNKAQLFNPMLEIPSNQYISAKYIPRQEPIIGIKELSEITNAAVKEVNKIREEYKAAKQHLLVGEERKSYTKIGQCKSNHWKSRSNVMTYLVKQIGIDKTPRSTFVPTLIRNGHPGYATLLNTYVPVTDRNFIPFLILLFIRTALNVQTLYSLKRDCLREYLLPINDLMVLDFEKPRSGSSRYKSLTFPARQKNGVVDLINFLLDYTAPFVEFAREEEQNYLFLFKSSGRGKNEIRSPGANFGFKALKNFIKENNLPDFNFAQIRPTVATLIYLQTRDIFRVQRLLGHSNAKTTILYIQEEVTRQQHNLEIRDGINSFIESILDIPNPLGSPSVFTEDINIVLKNKVEKGEIDDKQAKSIISGECSTGIAKCKDPMNSPIPGEIPGKICRQLHMCVFCPNAWIFLEDVAKVIHYRDSLLADRKNFTESVWNMMHGEAFRAITEDILPSYSEEVISKASKLAREMFIPYPL